MAVPVRAGEILAGKYRVERVLGRGGMGVVVAARHVELDELVAMKFLLPDALTEPEAVARFLKEARASVRIKSEHVARVHDVGQLDSGAPYIVMEYLDGQDLGALASAGGVLPVDEVVDYVAQACEAIANAHSLGIIHRDLKPANLMLVRRSDGTDLIKVLDFGVSKITSQGGADGSLNMTRTAAVLGSPLYMSPEQMMSPRDVDGRADIWALGAILYELLTGTLPFEAETLPAIGVLIATRDPRSVCALRPEVPTGLEAVVARCLAKRREDRFANVALLAQALGPFAPDRSRAPIERASRILGVSWDPGSRSSPISSPPPISSGVEALRMTITASHLPAPVTGSSWGNTAPVVSRRRKLVTVAGAFLSLAGAVVALVLADRTGPTAPIQTPPPSAVAPPSAAPGASGVTVLAPLEASSVRGVASLAPSVIETAERYPSPPPRRQRVVPQALARPIPAASSPPAVPSAAPAKKSIYEDM
jgi:serine/threonine protein kinase